MFIAGATLRRARSLIVSRDLHGAAALVYLRLFFAVLSMLSLGEQLAWFVAVAAIFGADHFGKIRPGAVCAGAIGVAI